MCCLLGVLARLASLETSLGGEHNKLVREFVRKVRARNTIYMKRRNNLLAQELCINYEGNVDRRDEEQAKWGAESGEYQAAARAKAPAPANSQMQTRNADVKEREFGQAINQRRKVKFQAKMRALTARGGRRAI
jgi:hypothetical protein